MKYLLIFLLLGCDQYYTDPLTGERGNKILTQKEWEDKWLKPVCHKHVCGGDIIYYNGKAGEVVAWKGDGIWFIQFSMNDYGYYKTEELIK